MDNNEPLGAARDAAFRSLGGTVKAQSSRIDIRRKSRHPLMLSINGFVGCRQRIRVLLDTHPMIQAFPHSGSRSDRGRIIVGDGRKLSHCDG
jgi:hypothetical protein